LEHREDDESEDLTKTGMRWSILKCLHEVLCNTRLDMPRSIDSDLEVAMSMIEKGSGKTKDANDLLDWVESKLIGKAISMDNIAYWENLLEKTKKGQLTQEEASKVPFMENQIKKYGFLSYCISLETDCTQKTQKK
jgi:hypothetical protein